MIPLAHFLFAESAVSLAKKRTKKVENRIWELSNGGEKSCRIVASYTTYLPSRGTQFLEGIPLPVFITPRDKKAAETFFCLPSAHYSALL